MTPEHTAKPCDEPTAQPTAQPAAKPCETAATKCSTQCATRLAEHIDDIARYAGPGAAADIRAVLGELAQLRRDRDRLANVINDTKALLFDLMQYPKAGPYPDGPCLVRSDFQEVRNVAAKFAAIDAATATAAQQAKATKSSATGEKV